jgi:hypothetical protein
MTEMLLYVILCAEYVRVAHFVTSANRILNKIVN